MLTFTSLQNRFTDLGVNTSAANLTRGIALVNDSLRYLTQKYYFNENQYTTTTVVGQQAYQLPFNIKDIINMTVSVGGILWQPIESPNRQQWDSLNTIPFNSDFPQFFYRFKANQINMFPAPTTNGNVITINYKRRIKDLSAIDYATGTVIVTNGSATVTGTGTSWTKNMAERFINIPLTTLDTTSGDNEWYQIQTVTSSTTLTLYNTYTGNTTSVGTTYTIGECPLLPEDYQDIAVYRALKIYYTSIVPNATQAEGFNSLYREGKAVLDFEFGAKSSNPVLTPPDSPVYNPNSFPRV
jgi:hypothetical protein